VVYASMGENGMWSGGYFVPERTFCAVPGEADAVAIAVEGKEQQDEGHSNDQDKIETKETDKRQEKEQPSHEAKRLFERHVMYGASDELAAHINLFRPDKNKDYERMTQRATEFVLEWFESSEDIFDDPRFAEPAPAEKAEAAVEAEAEGETLLVQTAEGDGEAQAPGGGVDKPGGISVEVAGRDEASPIDIAAAASLVPDELELAAEADSWRKTGSAGGDDADMSKASEEKSEYLRYLIGIAQQSGPSLRSYLPSKLPTREQMTMPKLSLSGVSIPSMPNMPGVPSMSMPSVSMFTGKKTADSSKAEEGVLNAKPAAVEAHPSSKPPKDGSGV